jgi:hypothetical protein
MSCTSRLTSMPRDLLVHDAAHIRLIIALIALARHSRSALAAQLFIPRTVWTGAARLESAKSGVLLTNYI